MFIFNELKRHPPRQFRRYSFNLLMRQIYGVGVDAMRTLDISGNMDKHDRNNLAADAFLNGLAR